MSEDDKAASSEHRLRQEAADWFALMRGPDAELRRADFNAWMAQSPDHRRAYNSVAETFSLTRGSAAAPSPPRPATGRPAGSMPVSAWPWRQR
jgi:transmembrane sensor